MDFEDTPDEAAYRTRVRGYLADHADELLTLRGHSRSRPSAALLAEYKHTEAVLYEGGLVGVTWPQEYGGQGGTPMQQAIVSQEIARAGVPPLINHIGIGMCGPTIIGHGTPEQQQRWLDPLLRADHVWCQLFSEPGSGSDLAALTTKAERSEDGWRVTGQKVWTTGAQFCDFGILLARTDPSLPKHRGLTMFVVDMHAPGVTIRPLRQMSGGTDFNEVFFDDVTVPDDWRLGEVNDGWRVAITTLMNERLAIGGGGGDLGVGMDTFVAHTSAHLPALEPDRQALVRQDFAEAYIESLASRYTGYRRLTALSKGSAPGPEGSAGKLAGTQAAQKVADVGVRLLGDDAVFAADSDGNGVWQQVMSSLPGLAIAGGTTEILKNILGERVLGLPSEPRPDKAGPVNAPRGGAAATAAALATTIADSGVTAGASA